MLVWLAAFFLLAAPESVLPANPDIFEALDNGNYEALEEQKQTFDLIVAGDVFTYVGDLSGVMEGCASALRPGGLMAFSVEDAGGEGFELRPTGRYAHSSPYIDSLAAASNLTPAYRGEMTLRDDPVPIRGRIVVLSKAP